MREGTNMGIMTTLKKPTAEREVGPGGGTSGDGRSVTAWIARGWKHDDRVPARSWVGNAPAGFWPFADPPCRSLR
jgi:hypothetical protein